MIPDAEVLNVIVDIISNLKLGPFMLKVNNRKLLDAMVELAGCEPRKFKTICSSIDKLDKEPWSKVKDELVRQKGVSVEQADELYKMVVLNNKNLECTPL